MTFSSLSRNTSSQPSTDDTLKSIDPKISFTIETENNGQISFLDTLVSREDGSVVTIDVYRKSTHTDRYLDFYLHHEKKHKISTASTPVNCASNLPSIPVGKSKQLIYVAFALESISYPQSFISNILRKKSLPEITPSPEELAGMFSKWADPSNSYRGFAVLPYIKGLI